MSDGKSHSLTVKGKNTIELRDVLIGEVWVGSGQSNMEWKVENANHAADEIANAKDDLIRHFKVNKESKMD